MISVAIESPNLIANVNDDSHSLRLCFPCAAAHAGDPNTEGWYKWDVFNDTEMGWLNTSMQNQATFAKTVGLKGVWFDMENYDWPYLWNQRADPYMPASSHTDQECKDRYYLVGRWALANLLAGWDNVTVLMYPNLAYTDETVYYYLYYFYAGMTSYAMDVNSRSVTVMSMNTYYEAYLTDWVVDYYEEQGWPSTGDYPNHYYVFQVRIG
jgi:hypothetical protein